MVATGKYSSAPTLSDIETIASEAFATIPRTLSQHVADVAIHVVDFPDDETLEALALESPFDLLGLYQGISLDQKSVADTLTDIDRIYLYRRPLLDYWCESGEDLYHVVRHVLIHEIGHHFGLSDDDMEAIEARA
ncbi:MAG: metallopeptidase family protein [Alphaproteobacteria bacterium]|nr:metallopeptidase family protein [Alphaproteobacteria bacterium]